MPAPRRTARPPTRAAAPSGVSVAARRDRCCRTGAGDLPFALASAGTRPRADFPKSVRPMKALSIRNLTKTYKNGVQALKGIDLDVEQGDFFALLGPNGAGKTTTIGIITSLVNKSGGTIEVFGHDIDRDLETAKSCIGIVPQEINFNQFETCETILVNQAGFYGIPRPLARERAEKYLKQLQLWDKRKSIGRALSGGMKRRLMIARALVHEPKLLILDEPTAGVDIEIRRTMWEFLRETNEQGVTIILTTHYLEEAENLCRNIAIIDKGRIIENDRMSNVLRKLQTETFVLNLREAVPAAPSLPGYAVTLVDDHTLEIEVGKDRALNDIFVRLAAQGIDVVSMRNKVNRLEELFMRLVSGGGANAGGGGGTGASATPATARAETVTEAVAAGQAGTSEAGGAATGSRVAREGSR
jgi:ABC-2 type transport system ATP-binding protein